MKGILERLFPGTRHNLPATVLALLLAFLGWMPLPATADTPISLLLMTDTEGQVESCRDCPGQQNLGGLSHRATLIARLRQDNPSVLLVDAGNTFFGTESLASQGKVIVAAYNALGYDAVNLSYRDFQLGRATTLALLREARFAVLSANLLAAERGELLVQPYVVKEVGGTRIALIGVTQMPLGLESLPHLQEQLAGIRIQPPLEALAQWLPKAKGEADHVVLLYYGSASGLQPIRERFGADLAAILVGGSRPESLPAKGTPPVVGTSAYGQHLTQVRLTVGDTEARAEVTHLAVEPTLEPDATMQRVVEAFQRTGSATVQTTQQEKEQAQAVSATPAVQQEGKKAEEPQGSGQKAGSTQTPVPPASASAGTAPPATSVQDQQKEAERPSAATMPSASLIIGEHLRLGMPLQEATALLGAPQDIAIEPGATATEKRIRIDYAQHGLTLIVAEADKTVQTIEVHPSFSGRFASGVRIGDPAAALLQAYGIPASMTPEGAVYPDKGLAFRFKEQKLLAATVSRPGQPPVAQPSGATTAASPEAKPPALPAGTQPTTPPAPQEREVQKPPPATAPPPPKTPAPEPQPVVTSTQEAQGTKPYPGLRITLPGGQIEAVLATSVTETGEPIAPTTAIPEDAASIYLVLKSALSSGVTVQAKWFAVEVERVAANTKLADTPLSLRANQRGASGIKAPQKGFSLGAYRVEVTVEGSPPQSLPFQVVPLLPPAVVAKQAELPRGFNLALAALGGRIESVTSEYNNNTWAAANLIDGTPIVRLWKRDYICTSCGWSSKDRTLPQDLVFSFYQGREALITTVVIDTTTWEILKHPDKMAKHVEVWVSTTSAMDDFTRVAGARLQDSAGEQVLQFSPRRAKYVKLRLLSNYGGNATQLGEVKIIEARESTPSILSDFPKNLALPVFGGSLVRFTSQEEEHYGVHHLVDGRIDTPGWRSKDGHLPQEFVFAFRGDQVALIDQVVLHPTTAHDPRTWPKRIAVSISMESPLKGFQEVGQFPLTQEPGKQAFALGQRARFVKLRILENFGGPYTSLGEVQCIEGSAAGYTSVLLETPEATSGLRSNEAELKLDEARVAAEIEPNNTPAEANPLEFGRFTKGTIDPLGEADYFKLTMPERESSVLTLELVGQPNIRTSLSLVNAAGTPLKRFDPGRVPAQRTTFSWALNPGEYFLHVTEPPIAMVLIWDTSGSMKDSTRDLQRAVEASLDQVRPGERLNLIRFSDDVEVLLPEFTSDRERLKAAAQGKFFAKGGTAFYDAVEQGLKLLDGIQGNRAVVVMTDGADYGSKLTHPAFWQLLADKRLRLYTIGLGSDMRDYQSRFASTGERLLGHAALATNGRFFFARTSDELQGFYQQIADELRALSTYYVKPTISQGSGSLSVVSTGERIAGLTAPQVELILDASGSMIYKHQKIDGRFKMDIAKDVMAQIIADLPDNVSAALRVYGHRIREGKAGACQDSELIFPFAKIDKPRLLQQVRNIRALGTTPLAYSLAQAGLDLANASGEKRIILVTDGKEECGQNPQEAARQLKQTSVNAEVYIIGLAFADETAKRDMDHVAAITGGRYLNARDQQGLLAALTQALAASYEVLDAAGTRVAGGLIGQRTSQVPEGTYIVVVRAVGKPITVPDVRITSNQFTRVELKKEGQEVGTQVRGPLNAGEAPWASGAQDETQYAPSSQVQPQATTKQSVGPKDVHAPAPEQRVAFLLKEAESLLKRQQLIAPKGASAYDRYREVLRLVPGNAEAEKGIATIADTYKQWGQKALEQKNYAEAQRSYGEAIKIDDRDSRSYLRRGFSYSALHDHQQAMRDYDRAIALDVKYAVAYLNRGWSYGELGEYQQAMRDLTHAIDLGLEPAQAALAYFRRGWSYDKLGKYQQAIRDYDRVITLNAKAAVAYHNRAWSYVQLGDQQQAIKDYVVAAQLGHKPAQKYLEEHGMRW